MDSWGILNVDSAAAAISRDDMTTSFRRKQVM
ncbi:jg15078, partial [Pararge aegeria aegeria]